MEVIIFEGSKKKDLEEKRTPKALRRLLASRIGAFKHTERYDSNVRAQGPLGPNMVIV
jgi:hypothetical protein